MASRCFLRILVIFSLLATHFAAWAQKTEADARPKIRTITAFIRLDRQNYKSQVTGALAMLRTAKAELTAAGYQIETSRITTHPRPEIVKGLSAQ